ncbi:MAG TPA: nuclear transport factor 2 family protein [Candidatus Acidoferrales bacterium]|jgi:ketosteroid isomerase-like protein
MTRRQIATLTLSVLAFFAVAWRTAKSATPPEDAKDEITKVDEERNQALQKGDVATLDRIYTNDLVYSNATGVILTKAQHLADLKSRGLNFRSFKHEDVQVTVNGETGFLTGISKSEVEFHGTVSSGSRRFLNVFVKRNGHWLVAAHFEANIEEPKGK